MGERERSLCSPLRLPLRGREGALHRPNIEDLSLGLLAPSERAAIKGALPSPLLTPPPDVYHPVPFVPSLMVIIIYYPSNNDRAVRACGVAEIRLCLKTSGPPRLINFARFISRASFPARKTWPQSVLSSSRGRFTLAPAVGWLAAQ
jgi:hypothetical protein